MANLAKSCGAPWRGRSEQILVFRLWRLPLFILLPLGMLATPTIRSAETTLTSKARSLSLEECVMAALIFNRSLQIERINPKIARLNLNSAYGYYDPVLTLDTHWDSVADSGGYDPADLSKVAVYRAESHTLKLGITGFLPSGLSYTLGGSYANSFGERNMLNFDSYNLSAGVLARQPLLKDLWIDQNRMLIRINKKNLRITELGVKYLTADVLHQVQQAYFELAFARENLKIQQQLLQVRRELLRAIQSQVVHGKLNQQDAKLAEAQAAMVQTTLMIARQDTVLAENSLRTLMGDPFVNDDFGSWVPVDPLLAVPEDLDFLECRRNGLAQRADLAQLQIDVEKADTVLKYHRNQLFPSLDVVAGYGRRGASTHQTWPGMYAQASLSEALDQIRNGDNPNDMIGVIFSLPIGRIAERGRYRASKELKEQAALLVKQKEELIMREISDALHRARLSFERVTSSRTAAACAQAAIEVEEHRFKTGKSSIFMVLELQGNAARAQTESVRALADYNQALSRLHFTRGTLLRKWRIDFDFKP